MASRVISDDGVFMTLQDDVTGETFQLPSGTPPPEAADPFPPLAAPPGVGAPGFGGDIALQGAADPMVPTPDPDVAAASLGVDATTGAGAFDPSLPDLSGIQAAPPEPAPDIELPDVGGLATVPPTAAEVRAQQAASSPLSDLPSITAPTVAAPQQTADLEGFTDAVSVLPSGRQTVRVLSDAQQQSLENEALIRANRAEAERAAKGELLRQENARIQAERDRQAQRALQQEKSLDDIRKDVEELGNAKVDPDRLWNSRSTAQKVIGAISVFIGGGLGVRTGRNIPLEIINRAIDQDIDAQKANITAKRGALAEKRSLFAQMLGKHKDEAAAELATRNALLENAAQQIEVQLGQFDGELAKEAGRRAILGVRAQQEANEERWRQQDAAAIARRRAAAAAGARRRRADELARLKEVRKLEEARLKAEGAELKARRETDAKFREDDRKFGVTLQDGSRAWASTTQDASRIRQQQVASQALVNAIDKMVVMGKKHGWEPEFLNSAEGQQMRALAVSAMQNYRTVYNLGQVQKSEQELIERALGDPSKVLSVVSKMKTTRREVVNRWNLTTKNELQPLDERGRLKREKPSAWDPKGGVAQVLSDDESFQRGKLKIRSRVLRGSGTAVPSASRIQGIDDMFDAAMRIGGLKEAEKKLTIEKAQQMADLEFIDKQIEKTKGRPGGVRAIDQERIRALEAQRAEQQKVVDAFDTKLKEIDDKTGRQTDRQKKIQRGAASPVQVLIDGF